ncbi:DUF1223 domain-containing protein [Sneathiella chinensis]|uniref:DUF1223 domain-containing protein n=1 Tax=Sneathiella chinensis TaxID=349750 RepID=A0ABQ5U7T7_9PROT|nr:DUF1223 domain-containing protein [Sneathiella chinensis]GLQ07805.1 hypothetical protein GCM10007924_30270 [Sneathiella chinensis]
MTKFFRCSLAIALVLAVALGLPLSRTAGADTVKQVDTVLELYTSQGCSSCPPADALLGEVSSRPGILGLSFAVTYWDYIGWKDSFADPRNDQRQTAYRQRLNARYVYTPQMIIAGRDHFVGSDRAALENSLQTHAGHGKDMPLVWDMDSDRLHIRLPARDISAVIWMAELDNTGTVSIRRGENAGRTITYHNVVHDFRALRDWDGTAGTVEIDLATLRLKKRDGCAILIQKDGHGPILAALDIRLD